MYELELQKLNTEHMHHQEVFDQLPPLVDFDVIFLDLGSTQDRLNYATSVRNRLRKNGVLLLDDWQMPHYRDRMRPLLESQGFSVLPLPITRDEHGRYLAQAMRQ